MIDAPFTYVERKKKKKSNNRNGRERAATPGAESLESVLVKSTTALASSGWNDLVLGQPSPIRSLYATPIFGLFYRTPEGFHGWVWRILEPL
jgi:hypothetical protein